ncbi:phosphatidate cytidylyltransferase [Mycoplasma sp. ES3157-GEN-MYC]|uniref:Phosphatidate cytidylyltransferase n=1 Tax=Mycoplasma miroungigenitalium TaxID=754515 RepID=A0A6M4J9D3_9MOLU|nr:phosphatidate cytidylyltransferase [Mycoplasma miroungigenitalium]MBU4690521.1 phosphatidate cytidylyltransferase [Mycoplasma miroungigenitalium]MBU4691788.1 phosphatidate cytidylyltransferase [Mycoplasma miroungigenitalium]QJR43614.1 phosphatidate cytidylyltransferase [Mycoplasma miroungigenitalium]
MKKNTLYERIIPGIIIAVVFLGTLIPLSIFSYDYQISRILSFVLIYVIFLTCSWEYFHAQRLKWYWAVTLSLLVSIVVFIPIKDITIPWMTNSRIDKLYPPHPDKVVQLMYYMKLIAIEPIIVIVVILIALAFMIIELFTRKFIKPIDRFARFMFALATIYILAIFTKVIHGFLVYDWKYWVAIGLISAASDSFGFLFGKLLGKKYFSKPFSPTISPNKTWEGFIGSEICGAIIAAISVFSLGLFDSISIKIVFSLIAPLFAVAGDLYFSYIKRINGIKDYSKLLRGHGGLLDRIDSISFITILMFLFILINRFTLTA